MKRFTGIALLVSGLLVAASALFALPRGEAQAKSSCGCAVCACPNCDGVSCSCPVCDCTACGCVK